MKQRSILRELEPKKDEPEKKTDKTLEENEIFKTPKHDLDVLPVNAEPKANESRQTPIQTEQPVKKKRTVRREMCGCGKEFAISARAFHYNSKQHKEWLKSQQEKEKPDIQNVETEEMEISIPQEIETQIQQNVKPAVKQTVSVANPNNFAIDYDRIINGVSDKYIKYKEQRYKQKEQNEYKTKYEKLLEEQTKKQKQQQAQSYLAHQNQVFGRNRSKRGGGWF